jgi:tRNA-specific 2-thiouridylase
MKILMAMSGGVDSSVAAHLLKSQGHELIGAMMKFFSDEDLGGAENSRACCTLSDADDARAVANFLQIPFYVFNFAKNFSDNVIEKFVREYQNGATPNPCIDCNRFMKFQKFLQRASELNCEKIATGHYARISCDANGRFFLKKGMDTTKDQSYVLYAMTQEQLSHTVFPLGELTKERVREIAACENFTNAEKRDSMDICFAPDGNYAAFIVNRTGACAQKGNFVNRSGKILGEHNGIINYTIGQRKGLGLTAPEPLFVVNLNAAENTVTVGSGEELFSKKLSARDVNLIAIEKIDGALRVSAKIRYAHAAQPATVFQTADDEIHVEFDGPQRAITRGQAVVLYDNETVIGGGTIC